MRTVTDRQAEKPIRLLLVAPALPIVGGQTVHARDLLQRLESEPALRVELQPINPRFLPQLQRIKYVRTVVTSVKYLFDLIVRIPRFDLIHIYSASYFSFILSPLPALLVSRLFGKRTILNYHSGEARDHLTRWRTAPPIIGKFDRTVVPSDYLVDVFGEFGLKASAIFNFIDLEKFVFRERNKLKPVFLSNRNFEAHYNVESTLRSFAAIQSEVPDSRLIVVGDGPQRVYLTSLAAELGLKNVEFRGAVAPEEMPSVYEEADIFLNSSTVDNMPISIIEAFACGLFVISSNAGGIPYIVRDNENGVIVPMNDPNAMADAAIEALENPEVSRRILAGAREDVKRYTWDCVKDQWIGTYRSVISDKEK